MSTCRRWREAAACRAHDSGTLSSRRAHPAAIIDRGTRYAPGFCTFHEAENHQAVRYHAGRSGTEVNCCVKYSIFSFNVFFFMLGFILLGIGVWAQVGGEARDRGLVMLDALSSTFRDPS